MTILQQFGIEGKLLIVQLINFAIMAFVMIKFVYPRVSQLLSERKESIATALKQADEAKKEAATARADHETAVKQAKAEASQILKEARLTAQTQGAAIVEAAKTEGQKVAETTKAQLAAEQESLRTELRAELADLTIETTRRVLSSVVTEKDSQKMVAAAAHHLAKEQRG